MENIILSPNKYIQGAGSLKSIAKYAKKDAFIIADNFVMGLTEDIIKESFKNENIPVFFELFNGECSKVEVNRLKGILENKNCKIVIGVGGGKTLDTAKAIAYYSNIPVMIVPTIASTDAPCSALSVLYTEEGAFDEYLLLPNNPDIVLMDTEIIAKAPARLLASGMGDALATYFEARACERSGALNMGGGLPTKAAMALAKLCFDTLIADGEKAMFAAQKCVCTKAVENIIEANTYLSGIGFESGGLAAAHAIHNGLTVLEECHDLYHGEKVAFGTLVQLFLENAPMEEIDEVLFFCKNIGLPTCLEDLGVNSIERERLLEVAKLSCAPGETIHNMPFEVTPEKVLAAILAADNYGGF
ncbi:MULTISPECIES: glycerol dehydrogenase [Cetobacterium]|jgi:glycerol dehydrogenase|uniref:Glycerol dehydrogenase n=1 Tax=Candidatus Cetobacterium colombiensis TaxID=3073100 RepID=A0ABU4W9G0_9FUSO|nr:glycerol dehydrogenase [Candidatus Cetobacterium colombiensis]MDX8335839.1 glycerol dehydrogenase [Candidatus Cetobacterium colombiensis]